MDYQEDVETLSKRTVDGALGVLKVCIASKTVKRVVFTASCTDLMYSGKEAEELDESYWSDVDLIYKLKPNMWSFCVSQVLAEKAVLEFGEQHELDVVPMILPFVIGPFICSKLPDPLKTWLLGVFEHGNYRRYPVVHVDDVVRAHIFMLEHQNPKGRYICSLSGTLSIKEIAEIIHAIYREYPIPTIDSIKNSKKEDIPSLSSKKLIDAGFEFKYVRPKEIFEEAIQCCKEKGYL
ncbi:hypothetical protein RIF29_29455 [Crotalaria pallida]|uniref:NAD-dependent epimerase/dehydratase domain-containing protein n=1 Tax=Crotalaria pallida TaxID=3830 RepID=A0AAN9EFJ3_CROPI